MGHGRVVHQYVIDSTGAPVRTVDGHFVAYAHEEDGSRSLDDHGEVIMIAIDPPECTPPIPEPIAQPRSQ